MFYILDGQHGYILENMEEISMPKVGEKKFGYGKKGQKAARTYAKKHDLTVKKKENPGYYAESTWSTYLSMAYILSETSAEEREEAPKKKEVTKDDLHGAIKSHQDIAAAGGKPTETRKTIKTLLSKLLGRKIK